MAERLAIDLLRGARQRRIAREVADEFLWFGKRDDGPGLRILAPACPFVGEDELRLLAWLTAFQRQPSPLPIGVSEQCQATLRRCADHLLADHARLDAANLHRSLTGGEVFAPEVKEMAMGGPRSPHQSRVLAYLGAKGAASSRELQDLGVSRQTISLMSKRGVLQRVCYGHYALGCG